MKADRLIAAVTEGRGQAHAVMALMRAWERLGGSIQDQAFKVFNDRYAEANYSAIKKAWETLRSFEHVPGVSEILDVLQQWMLDYDGY